MQVSDEETYGDRNMTYACRRCSVLSTSLITFPTNSMPATEYPVGEWAALFAKAYVEPAGKRGLIGFTRALTQLLIAAREDSGSPITACRLDRQR